jgi:hypothetical protein
VAEQALEDLRTIYNEINALTEDSYKTSAETIETRRLHQSVLLGRSFNNAGTYHF